MPEKFIPAKQDIEDDFWATLEEQTLVHDTSRQHISPIKSGTSFHPLQLLEYPQPRQKKDHGSLKMKVLFLSLLLGVICAAQEEEAQPSLSEVPGMV